MKTISVLYFCLISIIGFAQAPEEILLWPDGAPDALGTEEKDQPKLFYYPAKASGVPNTTVVICPGGGYQHLALDKEGVRIAEWFNKIGISVFVLRYRLGSDGYHHPVQLHDAQRAIRIVRSKYAEWHLDPHRIGIMGFSAGGHLAATAGTHWDYGNKEAQDSIDIQSSRPDFMALGYAVITMQLPFTHKGSRDNLLGKDASDKLVNDLSNELQVNKDTPPTFLFHTREDKAVPVQNSLMFYEALIEAGVPGELHIFQRGRHGLGFGPKTSSFRLWRDVFEKWLQNIEMLE